MSIITPQNALCGVSAIIDPISGGCLYSSSLLCVSHGISRLLTGLLITHQNSVYTDTHKLARSKTDSW